MFRALVVLALILCATGCQAQSAGQDMVLVPGGTFTMGKDGGEDNPSHSVTVSSFWIAKYELTTKEWRKFTEETGAWDLWDHFEFLLLVKRSAGFRMPDDWPIYFVSWYDAVWYCNWRSQLEGLKPVYDYDTRKMKEHLYHQGPPVTVRWRSQANGYRLPTEAEWEYAARGGATGQSQGYPAGFSLFDVAWYRNNSEGTVHPVGKKQPNSLGLYDMIGNVGEWCWDYYGADYYGRSPAKDPAGPDRGYDPGGYGPEVTEIRSVRGSSWMHSSNYVDVAFRFLSLALRGDDVGIRLVRSAN